MKFEVGDILWLHYECYNRHKDDQEVTITQVGSRWIYLSNRHRVDKKTLIVDGRGCSSPGKCYLSKKDCDDELALIKEWGLLRRNIGVRYNPPKEISLEIVKQAREILGL
jgi:hypothetical protein